MLHSRLIAMVLAVKDLTVRFLKYLLPIKFRPDLVEQTTVRFFQRTVLAA